MKEKWVIDLEFYDSEYKGIYIEQEEFESLLPRCWDIINKNIGYDPRYMKSRMFSNFQISMVKLAVCAQLERFIGQDWLDVLNGQSDSGITSEKILNVSISYDKKQSDEKYDTVQSYLNQSGLLARRVWA